MISNMHEIHALVLGIVEGITEFLPISSTGHLILTSHLLKLPTTEFLKSFEVVIQLGAILAVLVLYIKDFFNIRILKKIIVGSIPTMIIGLGLYKIIKNNLLGSETLVLWAILLGGAILIIFEALYRGPDVQKENLDEITYREAFLLGIFQSLAVIPGVSRSAATIVGGLALGIPRETIVKFSFLLAVPVMLGASGLDIVKTGGALFQENMLVLVVGFISAFLTALFAMKFLLQYIKRNNFTWFGVYRIVLALLFFFVIM
jgi:undecaprenyl-diphosphatase